MKPVGDRLIVEETAVGAVWGGRVAEIKEVRLIEAGVSY
jgi:hypothetical protein